MTSWQKKLPYDPLPILLESGCETVAYFARRDLLEEDAGPVDRLWNLPEAQKILHRQMKNGRWKYPSGSAGVRSVENYDQIETFRNLGFLVEKFGFTRRHPAVRKAAQFLFSFQTEEGDFRGIYGSQYSPNYSAAIMELLIKAGYGRDPRIAKGLQWLLSVRQDDGGWAIPFRTAVSGKWESSAMRAQILQPNRAKPFSYMVTGVVLRAFAVAPGYRRHAGVQAAGKLLASRFFRPDSYIDRKAPSFWIGFSFPFWFTDLLSALDSLSRIGFLPDEPDMRKGLDWFTQRQQKNGGWSLKILKGADKSLPLWFDLSIGRVFKRCYSIKRGGETGESIR